MKHGLYIDSTGNRRWFKNGKLHREDGPAYISRDGRQCWYHHGVLHREDGPAIITQNNENIWYINGGFLTQNEHQNHLIQKNLKSYLNS